MSGSVIRMIRIRHSLSDRLPSQVAPVIGAGPVAGEFLAQMYRVVAVDEHERLAGRRAHRTGRRSSGAVGVWALWRTSSSSVSAAACGFVECHDTYYSYK